MSLKDFCTISWSKKRVKYLLCLLILGALTQNALGQTQDKYMFGEQHELEIIVHIMGEVHHPGEYKVRDNTNLAELLAKAGGPTEFSNLNSVIISRLEQPKLYAANGGAYQNLKKRSIKVSLGDYLKKENKITRVPDLLPGDIVLVPRNNWHKWRLAATIVRDLSVVASAYFLYLRATKP